MPSRNRCVKLIEYPSASQICDEVQPDDKVTCWAIGYPPCIVAGVSSCDALTASNRFQWCTLTLSGSSLQAVFLYRGGSGCEKLWKQIEHQDITLVEQSAEHAPAELILNARAYSRPRRAVFSSSTPSTVGSSSAAAFTTDDRTGLPSTGEGREVGGATATAAVVSRPSRSETSADDSGVPDDGSAAPLEAEKMEFGGLLMKLSLPNSPCCRELAQLLHGLSDKAWRRR